MTALPQILDTNVNNPTMFSSFSGGKKKNRKTNKRKTNKRKTNKRKTKK